MAIATVLAALLKIETRGYTGPPPALPIALVQEHEGDDGLRGFVYDVSPDDLGLSVEDVCAKLGSRLERWFLGDTPPLPAGPYARRISLDFALIADADAKSFGYSWPLDFLAVAVDAQISLSVSHYIATRDDDDAE